jgi:hypothetical protein
MYITVTIPSIRTVVTPVEGVDTREDQIEALRVLSAGNTLIIVLLGGVLALQVRELNGMCFFLKIWRMEHSQTHPPSFFLSFFVTGTKGGTGVGAEIGNERSGQNCGRGSEGKRRSEEGSVTDSDLRKWTSTPISL